MSDAMASHICRGCNRRVRPRITDAIPDSTARTSDAQPHEHHRIMLSDEMRDWTERFGDVWDVDHISIEISIGAIAALAQEWVIGGSPVRENHGFPDGLEIATAPYSLRLRPTGFETMNTEEEEHASVQLGDDIVDAFRREVPYPALLRPRGMRQAARCLARAHREAIAPCIQRVLQLPVLANRFRLWACKYGMKRDVNFFYQMTWRPVVRELRSEMGDEWTDTVLQQSVVDLGTHGMGNRGVCVVAPRGTIASHVVWADWRNSSVYSAFGSLGNGYGGCTIKGNRELVGGVRVEKVNVYVAGVTHYIKAMGSPTINLPVNTTEQWMMRQRVKLMDVLETFEEEHGLWMHRTRIEIRFRGIRDVMDDQILLGHSVVGDIVPHICAHTIPLGNVIARAREGVTAADKAGLFSTRSTMLCARIPQWKRMCYYRVLHRFGYVNKLTHRAVLRAEDAGDPWGDVTDRTTAASRGTGACDEDSAKAEGVNVPLPEQVLIVRPHGRASAEEVRRLGWCEAADAINWDEVARLHGRPGQGTFYQEVSRKIKWRRMPSGRGRFGAPCLTATKAGGQTVGAMGEHLASATANVIALGLHDSVSIW
jgi:hypothetical protein